MIHYRFTLDFKEPNGLAKEALMQHDVAFQLLKLAQFWTSLHDIQIERTINEDNSVKVTDYIIQTEEHRDQFQAHALENGVDIQDLIGKYTQAIEALGGTLTLEVTEE